MKLTLMFLLPLITILFIVIGTVLYVKKGSGYAWAFFLLGVYVSIISMSHHYQSFSKLAELKFENNIELNEMEKSYIINKYQSNNVDDIRKLLKSKKEEN